MFIEPSTHAARKGTNARVLVETSSSVRLMPHPENDDPFFEEAALLALAEANENGFRSVSFDTVRERIRFEEADSIELIAFSGDVISNIPRPASIVYAYEWTFDVHEPTQQGMQHDDPAQQ